jgi:hypothetical protein
VLRKESIEAAEISLIFSLDESLCKKLFCHYSLFWVIVEPERKKENDTCPTDNNKNGQKSGERSFS